MISDATFSAPVKATPSPTALDRNLNPAGAVSSFFNGVLFTVPPEDQAEFQALPDAVRVLVIDRLRILERMRGAGARQVRAVARAISAAYGSQRGYSETTLLTLHYDFQKTGDWRVLVDRARAKTAVQTQPAEFVAFWRGLVLRHKRSVIQARAELLRIWTTGRDNAGKPCVVPGFGKWQDWFAKHNPGAPLPAEAPVPSGWGRSQLYRLKPKKAVVAMARIGSAAAREHLPHNLTTREGMRFLEKVTFDDVKTDWRVIDTRTGEVCDLWLLVAIDRATGLVLGYWMRPALAREDGTQQHLTLHDMKQLCGWVLWTWGLPSYVITWKLERGTATVAEATRQALLALFGGRVVVSYSSMIGGKGVSGYAQRGVGNSRGKAGHEATNNLLHNVCDDIAGQTGPNYARRPMDLAQREKHAGRIWAETFCELPEELRDRTEFPVRTLLQARAELNKRFNWMNSRTDHALEGYEAIWEWRESDQHSWQPMEMLPPGAQPAPENRRKRKHSPLERANQLRAAAEQEGHTWSRVDGAVLVRLYDTHRLVTVTKRGEVEFKLDDRKLTFRGPDGALECGAEFLAFYNEQNPEFVHLTQLPPHGGYVATCKLRLRAQDGDAQALEDSLRYTGAARAAAEREARELAGEGGRIAEIEANNAALIAEARERAAAIDAERTAPAVEFASMAPASDAAAAMNGAEEAIESRREDVERAEAVNTTREMLNRAPKPAREESLPDW